jgi:hypothetical protein
LRRYIPTLIGLAILLGISGVAVYLQSSGYEFSLATISVVGILAGLGGLAAAGALLAFILNVLAALAGDKSEAVVIGTKAEGPPKPGALPVPLTSDRSLTRFYLIIGLSVLGFLVVRSLTANVPPGYPLDRLPDFNYVLFTTPGDAIPGWPGFIPGPGQDVTAAMLFFGIVPGLLVGVVISGFVLAQALKRLDQSVKQMEKGAAADKPAAKAAPVPKGEALPVPLTTHRSLVSFYVILGLVVLGFLFVRAWAAGAPLAYPFDRPLDLSVELFTLPGERVEGLPDFIAGPGDPVRAWHALVLVVGVVIVGAIATGIGLARGAAQLDQQAKAAEKSAPAWPSQEWARIEPKIQQMVAKPPIPKRLSGMDQFIIALFLVIIGIVLFLVIPGLGLAVKTDQAVQATQIAALWTPTPLPGPTATLGPAPDVLFAALPAGDAAAGQAVTEAKGCVACHVNKPETGDLLGVPWLVSLSKDGKGVADHAQERWQGADYTGRATSAEGYLYESIRNPGVYLAAGYQPLMPALELTDQELADTIAYLLTLK